MKIFRDTTCFGEPVWVCVDDVYLYTASTLLGLVLDVVRHWRTDARLAG